MKKKILKEYYKNIFIALFLIILSWLLISFFVLFNGKSVDMSLPDNLILSFEQYILFKDNSISINNEGLEALEKNNLWVQLVDGYGNVIFSQNTPVVAQDSYSTFELVNYSLVSNRLDGQTLYLTSVGDYILILGASSNIIQKMSISVSGFINDYVFLILILIIVAIICVILAGYFYTSKIARPLLIIISSISDLAYERKLNVKINEQSIFSDVMLELSCVSEKMIENQKMRQQWISNISHDLKTPLTSIKGYAEVLCNEEYSFGKTEIVQYSTEILKSEKNIEELLQELILSQKIAEGKIELDYKQMKISDILKSCNDEFTQFYMGKVNVNLDLQSNLIVNCDERYIKRCILNIMHNSVTHNDENILVCIKSFDHKSETIIEITDNGKGVLENELNDIFERYYRGTASQTKQGTGLGLSIAKEIIYAHKWSIKAENLQLCGLKFTIKIPK